MPASSPFQVVSGNMRGSVSTPDTDPLTPEYEHSFYSPFYDSVFSQPASHEGGEVSLGNSISQLASYQRGFVPTSPPLFDDVPDEYPVSGGYNLGLTSYERMNNLRRNDSLNLQSNPVHVPRAIRGSPSYSDCSSPSRESHAFFGSARPITNTRSNSPVYADPIYNREFKNSYHQFGPDMTDQQLVNLRKLNALQHASPSSAETSRQQQQSSDVLDMKNLNIVMNIINSSNMNSAQRQQMITTLMNSLTIHQNQQNDQLNPKLSSQSWSPSPPVDNGNNEFNFSVLSSAGSSNGSLYGRNSYYNGNMAIPVEQALFEENARNHRTAQASMKQDNCPCYNGDFPIRENKNPTYSVKVFLGGVPWDITEENLVEDFSRFGRVTVEWPKGVNKGLGMDMNDRKDSQKKGYVYVIFEADKQVKALLAACTQDLSKGPDTLFFPVSSKKFKLKMVQVIPWAICDSNYQKSPHMNLNPKSTVFVGALHGVMHAQFLFNVFDSLFQGVVYAGIDTDKFKYPIGSARVMFNNMKSYMQAVNAQFVDIKTPKFQKTVQVDPYLEDSPCSICHHQQGPYFCKAGSCFNYFCHKCWQVRHPTKTLLHTHQPLMRNSKAGNMAAPSPASALLAHRRALQGQNQASGNMMTSEQGGQSNGPTYRGVTLPAYSDVNGGGDFAAALLNNNNNYYWKNDNAGVGMMNMNAAGAGGDLIRGNLD